MLICLYESKGNKTNADNKSLIIIYHIIINIITQHIQISNINENNEKIINNEHEISKLINQGKHCPEISNINCIIILI